MASLQRNKKSGIYYASYRDENGRWKLRSTKTKDEATAQAVLNKWANTHLLVREGVISAKELRCNEWDLAEQKKKYIQSLQNAGRTPEYVKESTMVLGRLRECSAEFVSSYLSKMREQGRSAKTMQKHLVIWKSFCRFSDAPERDDIAKLKVGAGRDKAKRPKRMLRRDEYDYWLDFLRGRDDELSLCIEVFVQTGYRGKELLQVRVRDFDAGRRCVEVFDTKNGRRATQYVSGDLAERLEKWVSGKSGREPLFPVLQSVPKNKMSRIFRESMLEAKADYVLAGGKEKYFLSVVDGEGKTFSCHSFRHSLCSWLAMSGCGISVLMRVARHSDPKLTLRVYGHLYPETEQQEIEKLFG